MDFSRDLRDGVASDQITISIRLWKTPRVKAGGTYSAGRAVIEVHDIELIPFSNVSEADVLASGEADRESLRHRAAHAGPIDDDTLVHRVEFHVVGSDPHRRTTGIQSV